MESGMKVYVSDEVGIAEFHPTSISGTSSCHGTGDRELEYPYRIQCGCSGIDLELTTGYLVPMHH